MKSARTSVALVCLLICGISIRAQTAAPAPYEATVSVPEVEVRSGPSAKLYATLKLKMGDRVKVVKEEEGGWLGIMPPPGSFSWIAARLVDEPQRGVAVVRADVAPVLAGSSLSQQMPDVKTNDLKRGAQVIVKDRAHIHDDGSKWWPIEPQSELRWIPKDSVKLTPAVETIATSQTRPAATTSSDPLWQRAGEAEKAGNVPLAMQLYDQCARQPGIDHTLQLDCYNRIEHLKTGNTGTVHPAYQPGVPSQAITGVTPPIAPAPVYPIPVPAQTTPNYPPGQSYSSAAYAPPAPAPTAAPMTSPPGRLRRAGFFIDGKQAYVLEDSQAKPLMYVTSAQPALSLEPYMNRAIQLTGPIQYRGDLRANYITATQVFPLQ